MKSVIRTKWQNKQVVNSITINNFYIFKKHIRIFSVTGFCWCQVKVSGVLMIRFWSFTIFRSITEYKKRKRNTTLTDLCHKIYLFINVWYLMDVCGLVILPLGFICALSLYLSFNTKCVTSCCRQNKVDIRHHNKLLLKKNLILTRHDDSFTVQMTQSLSAWNVVDNWSIFSQNLLTS